VAQEFLHTLGHDRPFSDSKCLTGSSHRNGWLSGLSGNDPVGRRAVENAPFVLAFRIRHNGPRQVGRWI
jgi:hypothetical protein